MDRRRFSGRAAALLAAAALPGLARAQAKPLDPKAEEKRAKTLKGPEEQKAKVAQEQRAKANRRPEEQRAKAAEEQKAKKRTRIEEQKARAVEEQKAKVEERAAKGKKGASLDDRRWQREQELRRFAALRRVGRLLLG